MAPTITSPTEGFTGTVAGVDFANGTAETEDEGAISYFNRHGYDVAYDLDEPHEDGDKDLGQAPGDGDGDKQPGDGGGGTPEGDGTPNGDGDVEKPNGSASKADWTTFAKSQGKTDEDLDGLNRDEIRDLFTEPTQ